MPFTIPCGSGSLSLVSLTAFCEVPVSLYCDGAVLRKGGAVGDTAQALRSRLKLIATGRWEFFMVCLSEKSRSSQWFGRDDSAPGPTQAVHQHKNHRCRIKTHGSLNLLGGYDDRHQ